MRDPNKQHYVPELMKWAAEHAKPGKVSVVDVLHDDDCPFLEGGDCSCEPDFHMRYESD